MRSYNFFRELKPRKVTLFFNLKQTCSRYFGTFFFTPFFLIFGLISVYPVQAETQFQGYLSLASDYVYRGISFANGKLSPQLSLSALDDSGIYGSIWISRDDISGIANNSQPLDIEVEYQLGYQTQFGSNWSIDISQAWLEYQTRNQPRNHDYRETRLNIHYLNRFSMFLSYANDIWTSGMDASTVAFSYRSVGPYQLFLEQELGAIYFDSNSTSNDDTLLSFIRLSFGKSITKNWLLGIDYHYSKANHDSFFTRDRIGSRWVLSSRYHFSF